MMSSFLEEYFDGQITGGLTIAAQTHLPEHISNKIADALSKYADWHTTKKLLDVFSFGEVTFTAGMTVTELPRPTGVPAFDIFNTGASLLGFHDEPFFAVSIGGGPGVGDLVGFDLEAFVSSGHYKQLADVSVAFEGNIGNGPLLLPDGAGIAFPASQFFSSDHPLGGEGTKVYFLKNIGPTSGPQVNIEVEYTVVFAGSEVVELFGEIRDAPEYTLDIIFGDDGIPIGEMLAAVEGSEQARDDLQKRTGFDYCFAADTPIAMYDGTYKPIQDIRPGDVVVSFDKDGKEVPGTVTRTFQNEARYLFDFWGTQVTPGHAYYCAGGRFAGRHVPLIDILRDDGAVQLRDGSLIRASTNCVVGSDGDRLVKVVGPQCGPTGEAVMRYGTRMLFRDGRDMTIAEFVALLGGADLTDDGLIDWHDDRAAQPFPWPFAVASLPKPEDYMLRRSGFTLEDLYSAGEWEQIGPQLPSPIAAAPAPETPPHVIDALNGGNGARPSSLAQFNAALGAPVEQPAPQQTKPAAPTLTRKQRRAMAAQQRKARGIASATTRRRTADIHPAAFH